MRPLRPILAAATAALLAAAVVPVLPEEPDPPPPRFVAIVGGTQWDGTGAPPIPDGVIIMEGDRIRAAGPRRQVRIPPGSVPVDVTGLTVLPGLVDMHVHLLDGVDPGEFVRRGVTSVRHLGDTPLERAGDLRRRVEAGELVGPRIFHCGLFVVSEPPLDRSIYPPAALDRFLILRSPAEAPAAVARLVEAGADVVKVKTEMSPEALRALAAAAAEAHLPVTFDNGGEEGSYDALIALDAGVKGNEHLSGIRFDDPAEVEAVLAKMLALRAYAVPTLSVLERAYSQRRTAQRAEFARRLAAGGGLVVAGTDTPSQGIPAGRGLHREIRLLAAAGLSNADALRAATGAAGIALGYQGIVGTIEAGAFADLIVVGGEPLKRIEDTERIVRVFAAGRQVHPEPAPGDAPPQPR